MQQRKCLDIVVVTKEKMLSRYRSKDDRDEKSFSYVTSGENQRWSRQRDWRVCRNRLSEMVTAESNDQCSLRASKSIPSIQKTIRLSPCLCLVFCVLLRMLGYVG